MRRAFFLIAAAVLVNSATSALPAQTRCGWYQMPTPGNLWLTDKDATWSITSQGEAEGPDAVDAEKAPDFDTKQFVETGVPGAGYGYGCACMSVDVDVKSKRVTKVHSGTSKPLSSCKEDKSLPKPS